MLERYFRSLYRQTMARAYGHAETQLIGARPAGGRFLDCGSASGDAFDRLAPSGLAPSDYVGLERNPQFVARGRERGLDVRQVDLDRPLPLDDGSFECVSALSVLEHLLHPCAFLREVHRALRPGGSVVILTPNISTWFTIALLLAGKMPSSGPHPDSEALLGTEQVFRVNTAVTPDVDAQAPVHRHLVVFSFRVLGRYLRMLGFRRVSGRAFGLYPLPNFTQPVAERLDPWHCHQMVFAATK